MPKIAPPSRDDNLSLLPQASLPKWQTPAELATEVFAETTWLFWPLAAEGAITLLHGTAKEGGKTTLLLAGLAAQATFFDQPAQPMRAVYMAEDSKRIFRQKLKIANLLTRKDIALFWRDEFIGVLWPQVIAHIGLAIAEIHANLLVVDTLAEWGGLVEDQENNPGAMLALLRPLKLLRVANPNLAIIITHHSRKMGGSAVGAIRGSSALAGAVDHIAMIQRPADSKKSKYHRRLYMDSRLEVPDQLDIEWHKQEGYQLMNKRTVTSNGFVVGQMLTKEDLAGHFNIPIHSVDFTNTVEDLCFRGCIKSLDRGKRFEFCKEFSKGEKTLDGQVASV